VIVDGPARSAPPARRRPPGCSTCTRAATMVAMDCIVGNAVVTDLVGADEMIVIGRVRRGATKSLRALAAGSQLVFVGVVDINDCWDSRRHVQPDWATSLGPLG
jgi:hypothetical protein